MMYWYGFITGIGFSLTVWAVARIITIRMWQKRRTITLAQMGMPMGTNIGVIKQEKDK